MTAPALPWEVPWYERPDGSAHAYRGIRSACRNFTWQADHKALDAYAISIKSPDRRCPECLAALASPAGAPAPAQ